MFNAPSALLVARTVSGEQPRRQTSAIPQSAPAGLAPDAVARPTDLRRSARAPGQRRARLAADARTTTAANES